MLSTVVCTLIYVLPPTDHPNQYQKEMKAEHMECKTVHKILRYGEEGYRLGILITI